MIEGTKIEWRTRSLLLIIAAVMVLVISGLAIIEQTRFSFLGWSSDFSSLITNWGVTFGTILLALGTWMTIKEMEQERKLTEDLVDETEKERKITRKTIDQMKKDREKRGKILTIAFGIDPLLNDLRTDKRSFDSDDPSCIKLPRLSTWDELDWAAKSDIEASNAYPGFSDDIEEYRRLTNCYQNKRTEARDEIAEILYDEFEDELMIICSDRGRSAHGEAESYASEALRCSQQHHEPEDLNQQISERALELRKRAEIDSLKSEIGKIETLNNTVGEGLEKVRLEYKREFGIAEYEIKEVSESTEFGEGYITYTPEPTYTN